jgi:hypothetical protein
MGVGGGPRNSATVRLVSRIAVHEKERAGKGKAEVRARAACGHAREVAKPQRRVPVVDEASRLVDCGTAHLILTRFPAR